MSDPASWASGYLNCEIRDPRSSGVTCVLPRGFAEFTIDADPLYYWGVRQGFGRTTDRGNLVGTSYREVLGTYEPKPFGLDDLPLRIVTQGNYKSRSDYIAVTNKVIHRVDPDNPPQDPTTILPGDVVISHTRGRPSSTPDPMPFGMITSIARSGAANPNPSTPYTTLQTSRYGTISSRQFQGMGWLETDLTIGPTGHTTASRDTAGVQTLYEYDDLGRVTKITPPAPELPTNFVYGTFTETYTDSTGTSRSHSYFKTVTSTRGTLSQPDRESTYQEFDGLGRLVRTERLMPGGTWVRAVAGTGGDDGLGHSTQPAGSGPVWVRQTQSYDALGSTTFVSEWHLLDADPEVPPIVGTTISYTDAQGRRDPFGRPTRVTTAAGSVTEIEHFGLNNRVTVRGINGDPLQSSTTTYYRDYQDRLRIVDAPEGADAIYSYDHLGNVVKINLVGQVAFAAYNQNTSIPSLQTDRFLVTNPDGQVRTFTFDALGRQTATSHPEKGVTSYLSFDARGNVLSMKDPEQTEFRYSYDAAGRLTLTETKAMGASEFKKVSETFHEDTDDPADAHGTRALGRPIRFKAHTPQESNPIMTRDLVYDDHGRVAREKLTGTLWPPYTGCADPTVETTFAYNTVGRLSEIVYPRRVCSARTPTRVAYTYENGLVRRVDTNRQGSDPAVMAPLITGIGYSMAGKAASLTYANGVTEQVVPDIQMRPGRIMVSKGGTVYWDSGPYRYDGASNIIATGSQGFVYDDIGRLISAHVAASTGSQMYNQSYRYDSYGNMTQRTGFGGDPVTQDFSVDGATNRISVLNPATTALQYTYNANGAVTSDGVRRYTWDRAGHMATIQTLDGGQTLARYDYDDRDWRARSSTGDLARQTLYVRDSTGLVLTEFARPISVNEPHWRKDYIYAVGRHVAVVENVEPSTPVGLRFTTSNPAAQAPYMQIQWNPVTDEDVYGYDVYRRNAGTTSEFVRLTSSPVTSPLLVDASPSVADATAYEYHISALDWGNVESARTVGRKVKVGDHTPPPVPGNLTAQIELCTALLSWNSVTDTDTDMAGYNVYRKTASTPDWPTTPRNGAQPLQQPSFQDDVGLYLPGITLQYRVEALDALGNAALTSVVQVQTQSCMASLFPPPLDSSSGAASPHRFIGDHPDEEVNYRVRYYHVDHLGTPRIITDSAGAVVAKNNLFPYGEPVPPFSPAGNTHWFTGHERESLAFQDYMLARQYALTVARFTAPDPAVTMDPPQRRCDSLGSLTCGSGLQCDSSARPEVLEPGVATSTQPKAGPATPAEETRLNSLFSYALNNPPNYTDPSGAIVRMILEPFDDRVPVSPDSPLAFPHNPTPDPARLQQCLNMCAMSRRGREAVCRSIPFTPQTATWRFVCWSAVLLSEAACSGLCYYYFGAW